MCPEQTWGRFQFRNRNQRTILTPIPKSESFGVDLVESESEAESFGVEL